MIAKPAILTCTRCNRIFIGWKTDVRPKGGPTCLKCQASQAWATLASASESKKARRAGGRRAPARSPAKRRDGRAGAGKRGAAKGAKLGRAKAKA